MYRRLLISAYNIIVVDKISSNAHHAIAVTHTCQNAWNQGEFLHWRPFWEWLSRPVNDQGLCLSYSDRRWKIKEGVTGHRWQQESGYRKKSTLHWEKESDFGRSMKCNLSMKEIQNYAKVISSVLLPSSTKNTNPMLKSRQIISSKYALQATSPYHHFSRHQQG